MKRSIILFGLHRHNLLLQFMFHSSDIDSFLARAHGFYIWDGGVLLAFEYSVDLLERFVLGLHPVIGLHMHQRASNRE